MGQVLHRRNRPPQETNMASDCIATSTGPRPKDALAAYLSDLAAQLHGPRRRREAILTELRDGLEQATQDRIATGLPPDRAASAAITQFGSPCAVADAFAGELTTAYARRTIACFIATGPLVGIWWLLLLHPGPWRTGLIAFLAAIPVIPLIIAAIATAGPSLRSSARSSGARISIRSSTSKPPARSSRIQSLYPRLNSTPDWPAQSNRCI